MEWDRVRSSYDQVAGEYERRFVDELAGKPRDCELLDDFGASAGDRIVEIGCGPGQIGAYVRRHGHHVIGIDFSEAMVKRAVQRLDAGIAGDMRFLPCASASVTGLVAFYSIIHLRRSELGGVLKEFARVLKPGGRMLISAHEGQGEFERGDFLGELVPFTATFFELDELVMAVNAASLDVVLAERRAPYRDEHETFRLYVEATKPSPVC